MKNNLQETYRQQAQEVVEVCRRAAELGYGAASGGNVSYRVEDNLVLVTPSGIVKRKITEEDLCFLTLSGEPVHIPEGRKPSGETFMHLHIMQERADVKGIMHAHPPILIGMSISRAGIEEMKKAVLPDAATALGPILTIPYAKPNCDDLGYSFDPYMQKSNAFLMQNHGCLVCSSNGVKDTVELVQIMEAMAKAVLAARITGEEPRLLTNQDFSGLDALLDKRKEHMPGPPQGASTVQELFAHA